MVELYTEEPLKKRHTKRLSVVADNDIVFVYIIYEIIEVITVDIGEHLIAIIKCYCGYFRVVVKPIVFAGPERELAERCW